MDTLTEEDPELIERMIAIVGRATFGKGLSLMATGIQSPQLTLTAFLALQVLSHATQRAIASNACVRLVGVLLIDKRL